MNSVYHELSGWVRRTDKWMRKCIEKKVSATGVYFSQHRALMILGRYPDISQVQLAENLEISPAAVTHVLKKLETERYIERNINQEDNRSNRLFITDKGMQVIEKSRLLFEETEEEMFRGFSDEELKQLCAYYKRICENLEESFWNQAKPPIRTEGKREGRNNKKQEDTEHEEIL